LLDFLTCLGAEILQQQWDTNKTEVRAAKSIAISCNDKKKTAIEIVGTVRMISPTEELST